MSADTRPEIAVWRSPTYEEREHQACLLFLDCLERVAERAKLPRPPGNVRTYAELLAASPEGL